jgi:trigger factor
LLGDYRAIRKDLEPVEVSEEALSESLEHVREHHQIVEQVERPAELGDLITLSGEGKFDDEDGEIIWQEDGTDMVMDPEKVFPDIPFVENLLGMSAEEDKEFRITFPEDTEEDTEEETEEDTEEETEEGDLAGKSAVFQVKVTNVQSREVPELNDELAQKEGDYQTLAELTEALREELLEQAERQAKSELMDEVVDEMLAEAEIVFPPAVLEAELDNRMESFQEQITRSGWQWQDWLTLQSESEESLKESWQEETIEGLRRGLVLGHFIEEEMITVEMADIDEKVDTVLERFSDNEELKEQLRSVYTQGEGLQSISNDIVMEKAQERIEAIVTGNAPDLEELAQAKESADEEE